MKEELILEGTIVDIENEKTFKGKVRVSGGKVTEVIKESEIPVSAAHGPFIMPGFVEAHIHIEDTLIAPFEFARLVLGHGTVAAMCDPHEIGNVMGIPGIEYMISQSKPSPLKFFYGAPSCVPATNFETSGATLGPVEIKELMGRPDIHFLGEFMAFPRVIAGNPYDMKKIQAAKDAGKPIDGHAPMVTGEDLDKYIAAGITTDHECSQLSEAQEKIAKGMKVIVRQGSAAKDLEVLYPLIDQSPMQVMLCTDDCHPDDLWYKGHIDHVVRTALKLGCKLFNVLRAATINPVKHYGIPVGLLRVGDPADLIVVDSLNTFGVLKTYINGKLVYDKPNILIPPVKAPIVNNFSAECISEADIIVPAVKGHVNVIGVLDRQLFTQKLVIKAHTNERNEVVSNPTEDVLKIVIVNRYQKAKPAVGFIRGFGLKRGAIAMSVSHDSHNVGCVGVSDADIVAAVNMIIKAKGGVAATSGSRELFLHLPIAGLMSDMGAEYIGKKYEELQKFARELGCKLSAPFPTLSFMALTVIPELKISDKGLFDVMAQKPAPVCVDK